ncbi:FAD/NAD(P)-binding domain-containing protein [Thozetella sp. PMI_491]|nr:FAD/NAD(P)-binding domain-containing protein [Thozetella sp. PMI_491]
MSIARKAVIIGAGPAGLAAAIRLKTYNGIDTEVYEIRPEPTTLGGAVNIPSNGLRLFDRLGLYAELTARGSSASQLIVHSMQSSVLVDVDMAGWSRQKWAHRENIPVHFDKRMTGIVEDEKEVTIYFADGTTATADLLLGCDGIHSAVRRLHVNPDISPVYSGISNMYSIVPASRLCGKENTITPALHGTLTPEGLLGLMPCTQSGDQVYWFYSREVAVPGGEGNREGWEAFGQHEIDDFRSNIQRVIMDARGEWVHTLREVVQKTDTIKFYPIYKMPLARTWSTRRCLLLGDAAHAMQPHVGQGTSMALEDVFLLSRLLESNSHSLIEVFAEYETVRRPRVEAIGRASTENGEIRKNTTSTALKMKEMAIGVGFWLYKTARLQKFGIGMNQKDFVYDILDEPIWSSTKGRMSPS